MRNFKEIIIQTNSEQQAELVIAAFADLDFEGIEETDDHISIFFEEEKYNEELIEATVKEMKSSFHVKPVVNRNWNAEWESGFKPVIIDNKVGIRANFHEPLKDVEHELIITPKMSFGTGHHATTTLMVRLMSKIDFVDKSVLDFGTGTGILAILAKKFGAGIVNGIDNDEWSINNAKENLLNNNCGDTEIIQADTINPELGAYDVVLANINLNVLKQNVEAISAACKPGAYLLISGFYEADYNALAETFKDPPFNLIDKQALNTWCCGLLRKMQ